MSIKVEMSGFCHSERSEESVKSVTIAVCYLLFHVSMSWPGRFMVFSARTQHESILIEWFHVVTGRFLTLFLPDTIRAETDFVNISLIIFRLAKILTWSRTMIGKYPIQIFEYSSQLLKQSWERDLKGWQHCFFAFLHFVVSGRDK